MISLIGPLVLILIAEYIGDFIFQSREIALNKSKDIKVLVKHMAIIFGCMGATAFGLGLPALYLAGCYVIIHGIQDWFVWRGYKAVIYKRVMKKFNQLGQGEAGLAWVRNNLNAHKYWEDKLFYDFIGADRLLHIITIIVLYGIFFL